MLKGARILITGGAGFIASHLIDRVIADNEVVIYDNLERNAFSFTNLAGHPHVTLVEGDVLDYERLRAAMRAATICIHAAAIAGIYTVDRQATRTMKVNFLGTYHALEAAVANKVNRFIHLSSSEVYGPFVFRGKETDSTTLGPVGEKRWVYAVSKLAGEHFVHAYRDDYGLEVVIVRPFNVYGPRQVGEGAVQQMVNRALANEDLIVYNDGSQVRSWCYVSDFVDGLCRAMFMESARNQVFNIGNPQATVTVLGLARTILSMTGSRSRIVFRPHPGPEVEIRVPDIDSAMSRLGYSPRVSLEEGLRACIDWYRQQRLPVGSEPCGGGDHE